MKARLLTHIAHNRIAREEGALPPCHAFPTVGQLCGLIVTLLLALGPAASAQTNAPPQVVIVSATMRAGTTFMDVIFRVNDTDDTTVKVRALAFKDGVRSFANVIRPVTFVEGTADKIGDAIPANANHALTWDVATDWNIDLGYAKFEILAMDGRGLLSFDWITIPAAGGQPALTLSLNAPTDSQVLDALFWQYAAGDPGITVTNGVLSGSPSSGVFAGVPLVSGSSVQVYAPTYILKQLNLDVAASADMSYSGNTARAGLGDVSKWHATSRPWGAISAIIGWGDNSKIH